MDPRFLPNSIDRDLKLKEIEALCDLHMDCSSIETSLLKLKDKVPPSINVHYGLAVEKIVETTKYVNHMLKTIRNLYLHDSIHEKPEPQPVQDCWSECDEDDEVDEVDEVDAIGGN